MLLLLTGIALAGGKWDGSNADVDAKLLIGAPPERIFSYLLDLHNLQAIFPEDCVGRWDLGDRTYGEGASAYVRYDMAAMHRRLAMTLTHALAPHTIDFDHLGRLGFITRWTLTPGEGGTEVQIHTGLNPPPAPFKGYYYTSVQPEWQGCYQRTLANLAAAMAK